MGQCLSSQYHLHMFNVFSHVFAYFNVVSNIFKLFHFFYWHCCYVLNSVGFHHGQKGNSTDAVRRVQLKPAILSFSTQCPNPAEYVLLQSYALIHSHHREKAEHRSAPCWCATSL